jgi:hypothetical protein
MLGKEEAGLDGTNLLAGIECVIWAKAATVSGAIRPPILIEVGHPL